MAIIVASCHMTIRNSRDVSMSIFFEKGVYKYLFGEIWPYLIGNLRSDFFRSLAPGCGASDRPIGRSHCIGKDSHFVLLSSFCVFLPF